MLSTQIQTFTPNTLNYSPVRPDLSSLQAFESVNQYFQNITNYKLSTEILKNTYQFQNELESNKTLSPQDASNQWDEYINTTLSSMSDADTQTKLKMQRYLELKKVASVAQINNNYQKNIMLTTLMQTTDSLTKIANNVRDVSSYQNALNTGNAIIDNAVNNGVLTKAGAIRLQESFKKSITDNFVSGAIDSGKFDVYKKEGVFNTLGISESSILKASSLNDSLKMKKIREAEYLKNLNQVNNFEELSKNIQIGNVGVQNLRQYLESGKINAQQYEFLNKQILNKPINKVESLNRFYDIANAITSGVYQGDDGRVKLTNLLTFLTSKDKISTPMVNKLFELQAKYTQSNETLSNMSSPMKTTINTMASGIGDTMNNFLSQFPVYQKNNMFGESESMPKLKEYSTIASVIFKNNVIDYLQKHKNIDIPTLVQLRTQSVRETLSPLLEDEFKRVNSKYFSNFKSEYNVDDKLLNKLIDASRVWMWNTKVIKFDNLPNGYMSNPIVIPLLDKYKNKYGVDKLYFVFTNKGIEPMPKTGTDKALEKIYGVNTNKIINRAFYGD